MDNQTSDLVSKIHAKLAYILDSTLWHWSVRLLNASPNLNANKTVLFCDVLTMLHTAKVQSLIALELRRRGFQVTVLLQSRNPTIEKIYKACVPDADFIWLHQIKIDQEWVNDEAKHLLEVAKQDIDGFLEEKIVEHSVGRSALSAAYREARVGQLNLKSSKHSKILLNCLRKSLAGVEVARKALSRKFDLAFVNEKGYPPASEVYGALVQSEVDVIQWVSAPFDGALAFKRYSIENRFEHPLALSDKAWFAAQASSKNAAVVSEVTDLLCKVYEQGLAYNRQKLQTNKEMVSREDLYEYLDIDTEKKTAIIFSHILYDATFFYGQSLFSNYLEWLLKTVELAIENRHLNWIIKVHPVNVWRSNQDGKPLIQLEEQAIKSRFGELPEHVKIMPAETIVNTLSIIKIADFGLTVRGTVGMELPCFGVPVVTAGTGRYSKRGFTIDPSTEEEYCQIVSNLQNVAPLTQSERELACCYYKRAIVDQPIVFKSFSQSFKPAWWQPSSFGANVQLASAKNYKQLKTEDVDKLVEWVVGNEEVEDT